jgi:hypothetical protein
MILIELLNVISSVNRPRFVILGQVEDTGIYKSIVYFPAVSGELVLLMHSSVVCLGTSISKNKNSSF